MNFNPNSLRARKAKAAAHINDNLWRVLLMVMLLFGLGSIGLLLGQSTRRFGYIWLGIALLAVTAALWYKRDLKDLPPIVPARSPDDILEPALLAKLAKIKSLTPQSAWPEYVPFWGGTFLNC